MHYNPFNEPRIAPSEAHGLKWKGSDGRHYESRVDYLPNGLRKIWFEISSFIGISPGAIHYYATLKCYAPQIWCVEEKKLYMSAGFGPEKPENLLCGIRVDVERKITKVEKDGWGRVIGSVGEFTNRFNTPKEVFEAAVKMFDARFGKGWQLCYDGCLKDGNVKDHWPITGKDDFAKFEIEP